MVRSKFVSFRKVLDRIVQADDLEMEAIMEAVRQRYAVADPNWEVLYMAIHKDPMLRKAEIQRLIACLEKDLQRNWAHQKRTPSHEGVLLCYRVRD